MHRREFVKVHNVAECRRAPEGLRVKARAAEIATKDDADISNIGDGSFIGLAQSINRDLFAMDGA